jgi:hypothetical protein
VLFVRFVANLNFCDFIINGFQHLQWLIVPSGSPAATQPFQATKSISIDTSFGNLETSTVARLGGSVTKY